MTYQDLNQSALLNAHSTWLVAFALLLGGLFVLWHYRLPRAERERRKYARQALATARNLRCCLLDNIFDYPGSDRRLMEANQLELKAESIISKAVTALRAKNYDDVVKFAREATGLLKEGIELIPQKID